MQNLFKKTSIVLMCSTALLLSACGGDDDHDNYVSNKKSFQVDADVLGAVQVHDVLTYDMPSVSGKTIQATTLVFTPKGTAPVGGWPVVVWAHGTTGGADKCAPSRNALEGSEKQLILGLVNKGYAVVAPDYEGLGNDKEPHPYLNLSSAAKSILYALEDANARYNNLSKNWSVVGWSQGGHAALGAAEFSSALSGYTYKGAVAIAPASYLAETLEGGMDYAKALAASGASGTAQAVPIAATLYTYAAIVSSGIKAGKTNFNYNQSFLNDKVNIAQQAETLCSPEVGQLFGLDIQSFLQANNGDFSKYQALQTDFLNDTDIKQYLQVNTPAKTKLPKPVIIFQGSADTTVPLAITQGLYGYMLSTSTDVELREKAGATHATVVSQNINEIVDTVDGLMKKS